MTPALVVLAALGAAMAGLLALVAWALPGARRVVPALLLVAATGARAGDVPFACPEGGRVGEDAPADYHQGPDARCVAAGSLAVLYGPDGLPLPRMTKVGPGWYLTAEGYRLVDEGFRRVQRERNDCREALAAQQAVPTPGVPVAPVVLANGRWPTAVLVGGLVLGLVAGGYVGCRVGGGCR